MVNLKRSVITNVSATANRPLRADPRQRALTWLRDHGSPRFVMSLMLASTIGCGFIVSITLHRIGLGAPIVRYPLAVLAGWVAFLALVSVWVWWQRRENARADERADFARSSVRDGKSSSIDFPGGGFSGSGGSSGASGSGGSSWSGGGGRFGGGGASESFAEGPGDGFASGLVAGSSSGNSPATEYEGGGGGSGGSAGSGSGGGGGKGSDWGFDLDGDGDFVVLLIGIVVVAAAVFGVVFYAVYSAPTFFAELLIDGGVGTWLYKRADVVNRPDWLSTAVRRSVWPVVVLVVMFVALAMTMRHVAPGATTLGQAWHVVLTK